MGSRVRGRRPIHRVDRYALWCANAQGSVQLGIDAMSGCLAGETDSGAPVGSWEARAGSAKEARRRRGSATGLVLAGAAYNISRVFDTHCHLTDLDDGPSALRETLARGVGVLCCGYDTESCRLVARLREIEPRLAVAYGLHPWFADQPLNPLLECMESSRIAAVGEIGLDLLPRANLPAPEQQRMVLEAQLAVAKGLGLPVSLHSRRAVEPLIASLKSHPGVIGVCHAFSGSVEQARVLLGMGLLIGVGGGVTRPNAQRIRRLVRELPLESFVLETDCPAIGVEGIEKALVRPWDVARVAATVAELKSVTVDAVEEVTDRNAARLFRPGSSQNTP